MHASEINYIIHKIENYLKICENFCIYLIKTNTTLSKLLTFTNTYKSPFKTAKSQSYLTTVTGSEK